MHHRQATWTVVAKYVMGGQPHGFVNSTGALQQIPNVLGEHAVHGMFSKMGCSGVGQRHAPISTSNAKAIEQCEEGGLLTMAGTRDTQDTEGTNILLSSYCVDSCVLSTKPRGSRTTYTTRHHQKRCSRSLNLDSVRTAP